MVDYLTKVGIKSAMDMLNDPEKAWMVDEHLDLMFCTGLMDDTDYVLNVIEQENAHDLIPIIAQSLMMDMKIAVYDGVNGEENC